MYVEFEEVPAKTPVACDDCEWKGIASQVEETGADDERWEFGETPEGAVGECPECGALAFVVESKDELRRFIVVGVDVEEQQFFVDFVAARDEEHAKEQILDAREYANDAEAYDLDDWLKVAEDCKNTSIEVMQQNLRELHGEEVDDATPQS